MFALQNFRLRAGFGDCDVVGDGGFDLVEEEAAMSRIHTIYDYLFHGLVDSKSCIPLIVTGGRSGNSATRRNLPPIALT